MPALTIDDAMIDWVERLHDVVDEVGAPIARAHGERLNCKKGCAACCTDGLTVFEIEAAVIERHYARLLEEGAPHAEDGCAFLGSNAECRIYGHRPYVCRTQGLPLRWLEREEAGDAYEARDVCPLNLTGEGMPLEALPDEACFTLGPFESRLAEKQSRLDGGVGRRVALRSLFAESRRHLPVVTNS